MQQVKDFIVFASAFSQILFFCICQLVGFTFIGSSSSPIFKLFILFTGLISTAIVVSELILRKIFKGTYFFVFCIFLPLVILADYFIETSLPLADVPYMSNTLLFFFAFSLTSIYSAMYVAQHGISHFAKWLDIIIEIITLASIMSTIAIMQGEKALIGGSSYQVMSYFCGFAFCLNLCFLLFGDKSYRFKIFRTKLYFIVSCFFLLVQLLSCIISGGRGGFVLLVVGSVYLLFVAKKVTRTVTIVILFFCFAYSVVISVGNSPITNKVSSGTERVFSYIDENGINMKKTSSRDVVYTKAFVQIEKDKYMGGGLFKANADFGSYPHNIMLEHIMQGGVIYMLLWTFLLIYVLYVIHFRLNSYEEYSIIPIMVYPLVMLQFSETYIYSQLFWFGLTYVLTRNELLYKEVAD